MKDRDIRFYVRNTQNNNLYGVAQTHDREDARTGRIIPQYKLIGQMGSHPIDRSSIEYEWLNRGKWVKVDEAQAHAEWDRIVAELPEYTTKEEHFITGLILPIWDRLRGRARVYRVVTDDGEMFVGRAIPPGQLQQVLKNLGVNAATPQLAPDAAIRQITNGDIQVELVNGWRIKRATVEGDTRLEVTGPDFQHNDVIDSMGMFKERINYKTRYFIPTGDEATKVYGNLTAQWPVADVIQMRDQTSGPRRTPPSGFRPDPTVEGEGKGEGGFVRFGPDAKTGHVAKPWLTEDKVKSPDETIENFFARTYVMPVQAKVAKLLEAVKQGLRERFVFLGNLPNTTEAALARDMIRTMPEELRAATDKAVGDIETIVNNTGQQVQALDSAGLDLLRRKVFVQDLLKEAELDRSVAGGLDPEQLEAENARLDALIAKVPSVQAAYEARQALWETVSNDLFERGVISEEARNNHAYVRHFVLMYAEVAHRGTAKPKKLSEPYRGYGKERKGHTGDISTHYLAVEIKALSDIYRDNAIEDMATEIGRKYDKRKEYAKQAKEANFVNLVGGPDNARRIYQLRSLIRESSEGPNSRESDERQQRKAWIEELEDLDPTYPYRKRIAMHKSRLEKILGELPDEEEEGFFNILSKIVRERPNDADGLAARGIFKAIHEREQMIRDTIGDKYVTPERLAQADAYTEWWYKRPNLMYLANTLTEAQMAMLVENSAEEAGDVLHIPRDMMRQALVLGGKRKGMLIPDWLAKQLDDLPVNRRSNLIVASFTRPDPPVLEALDAPCQHLAVQRP